MPITKHIAGWGSSTMELLAPDLAEMAAGFGARYYNGGKGGESVYESAARIGSLPVYLTIPNNSIPESGSVKATSKQLPPSDMMKAFAVKLGGVTGRLSNTTRSGLVFTRSVPGLSVSVPPASLITSIRAVEHRASTWVINMGKNTLDGEDSTGAAVINETAAAFDHHLPDNPRTLILGHFSDTGRPLDDPERTQILRVNAAFEARYGELYVDLYTLITSPQIWEIVRLIPTPADIKEQVLGNLPPSLAMDAGHFNAAGQFALMQILQEKLVDLGWYQGLPTP